MHWYFVTLPSTLFGHTAPWIFWRVFAGVAGAVEKARKEALDNRVPKIIAIFFIAFSYLDSLARLTISLAAIVPKTDAPANWDSPM